MQLTQVGSAESADVPDDGVAFRAPRRIGQLVYSLVLQDPIRQRRALEKRHRLVPESLTDFADPVISGSAADQATWDPGRRTWNRAD